MKSTTVQYIILFRTRVVAVAETVVYCIPTVLVHVHLLIKLRLLFLLFSHCRIR